MFVGSKGVCFADIHGAWLNFLANLNAVVSCCIAGAGDGALPSAPGDIIVIMSHLGEIILFTIFNICRDVKFFHPTILTFAFNFLKMRLAKDILDLIS